MCIDKPSLAQLSIARFIFFERELYRVSGFPSKPHRCLICGTAYTCQSSLKKHMKMHTGETTCPICQQTFSMMFALRRHMRDQHRLDQETVDSMTKVD